MAMLKKGAEKLLGVEAIMHTPFKENYELDLDGARKLVRHMIDNGIVEGNGCILVAGAVGEFMAMSPDERKQLAEVCLDEADGKVPMIINVADTNVNVIKELAHHAAEHGAYCVQLSPPYYTPLSDQELVDYYKDISDEISIGMMIYANYWASQVYFDNIIGELIQIENVVAFKWNHPDALVYHDVLIEYADKVAFMANDSHRFGMWQYMIGMRGFCSQVAVYAPQVALREWEAIKARDWERLSELFKKWDVPFLKWNRSLKEAGITGPGGNTLKYASELLGLPAGPARPPHDYPCPEKQREEIRQMLVQNGAL